MKKKINHPSIELGLEMLYIVMRSFIDLFILMGCDYLPKVQGVGPKTAYNLVRSQRLVLCSTVAPIE